MEFCGKVAREEITRRWTSLEALGSSAFVTTSSDLYTMKKAAFAGTADTTAGVIPLNKP